MSELKSDGRRQVLRAALATGAFATTGAFVSMRALAAGKVKITMQLGWIPGGNQVGEVTANRLGYYEQEGIEFNIQAGGPNIDGVAIVASKHAQVGQISSSPSVMLAVSQDLPIKCFAVGLQQHPYCFFSLKKNPIRTPQDMIGKRIGIQPTGMVLLRAMLAKNNIPESKVHVVPVGADMLPLLSGQVDAVTGWQTNVTALKPLGANRVDLRLWDAGVRLYALPYYAHTSVIQSQPDMLGRFMRATARGWAYADKNRDKAIDLLVKEYPNLNWADERAAINILMKYAFDPATHGNGWGTMEAAIWQDQISMYAQLKQFSNRVPTVDEIMTMQILQATRAARLAV